MGPKLLISWLLIFVALMLGSPGSVGHVLLAGILISVALAIRISVGSPADFHFNFYDLFGRHKWFGVVVVGYLFTVLGAFLLFRNSLMELNAFVAVLFIFFPFIATGILYDIDVYRRSKRSAKSSTEQL